MVRKKPSLSSAGFLLFSGIFLMLVQFGYIPPIGDVSISVATIQYAVLFWLSIILFISSLANMLRNYPQYARWTMGYSGDIFRTVRRSGKRKDFFIRGVSDAKVRDVLLDNWPFDTEKSNSDWRVIDSLGNEVSDQHLESITETIEVVFPPDDPV